MPCSFFLTPVPNFIRSSGTMALASLPCDQSVTTVWQQCDKSTARRPWPPYGVYAPCNNSVTSV
jgi:hypothetical protein